MKRDCSEQILRREANRPCNSKGCMKKRDTRPAKFSLDTPRRETDTWITPIWWNVYSSHKLCWSFYHNWATLIWAGLSSYRKLNIALKINIFISYLQPDVILTKGTLVLFSPKAIWQSEDSLAWLGSTWSGSLTKQAKRLAWLGLLVAQVNSLGLWVVFKFEINISAYVKFLI
jgi:hypothetical protein